MDDLGDLLGAIISFTFQVIVVILVLLLQFAIGVVTFAVGTIFGLIYLVIAFLSICGDTITFKGRGAA